MENTAITCIDLNMNIWNDKSNSVVLIYNKNTDACCALTIKENSLFVVFKYTDSSVDWSYNYKFYPKRISPLFSGSKVRIHRGHLLQYKSIEQQYKESLLHLLESSNIEIKNIVFTGFSLGGSLCKIAAWDTLTSIECMDNKNYKEELVEEFRNRYAEKISQIEMKIKLHCYCFGAPNVGNKHFVNEFNKIEFAQRIVYGNDPVPVLPPRMFGYSRTKNPLHITWKNGQYKFNKSNRSLWTNMKIISDIIKAKVKKSKIGNWQDHSLIKIKNSLQK